MKAVITVVGKDAVGILAKVSGICAENGANIIDVSQTIMDDLFVMIMIVDISKMTTEFTDLQDKLDVSGKTLGMKINTVHEDIFNSMHKI